MKEQEKYPFKIGLALGGGAALGFAHVGVLEVLEQNNIKVDVIAGSSMGAIIGGAYASGLNVPQMLELMKKFNLKQITRLNFFNMLKTGLFSTEKMASYFEKLTGVTKIEQCKIPFSCTSVDLHTGKPYVFKKGSFGQALMASSAIPGIFKPVKKGNKLLVDGGVLNNVPFDVVKKMGADFVIGIDVVPQYFPKEKIPSTAKIIMCSFGLMQLSNEKLRKQAMNENLNFLISIPSQMDEQNWTPKAIMHAYNLGKEYAQKNIAKLKRKLNQFQSQFIAQNDEKIIDFLE